MLTHVVLFKLSDASSVGIDTLKSLLESMSGNIPVLRSIQVGVDLVHSERSYDVALVTKFDSLEDLQTYQVHPYHAEVVVPHVKAVCSSVVTVDFE